MNVPAGEEHSQHDALVTEAQKDKALKAPAAMAVILTAKEATPNARYVLFEREQNGTLVPIYGRTQPSGNMKRTLHTWEIGEEGEARDKFRYFVNGRIALAWVRLRKSGQGGQIVDWGGDFNVEVHRWQRVDDLIQKLAAKT